MKVSTDLLVTNIECCKSWMKPTNGHLNERIMCRQGQAGQEDCLFMSIAVKKEYLKNKTKVPILYHIHGGGFTSGSGTISNSLSTIKQLAIIAIWSYICCPKVKWYSGSRMITSFYCLVLLIMRWTKLVCLSSGSRIITHFYFFVLFKIRSTNRRFINFNAIQNQNYNWGLRNEIHLIESMLVKRISLP